MQKGRHAAVSTSSYSLFCFILKEVRFSGLLGPSDVHHFPSRVTEYRQTPVGLLSNIEADRFLRGPLCMPSDGQHTARYFRRATFPEPSYSLSATFLASPTCPRSLRHGPRLSCHEQTLCLKFFEDLVPEVTLLKEKVSILPCCVAHGTLSVSTCLKVRPRIAVQKWSCAAVSMRP